MTFPVLLKKSLFAFVISAAAASSLRACPDAQNGCDAQGADSYRAQVIQEAFVSACHTSPDPASLNYYLDQLENGARTAAEIKVSIEKSCATSKTADPCQHVSGLSDLCKTATN